MRSGSGDFIGRTGAEKPIAIHDESFIWATGVPRVTIPPKIGMQGSVSEITRVIERDVANSLYFSS